MRSVPLVLAVLLVSAASAGAVDLDAEVPRLAAARQTRPVDPLRNINYLPATVTTVLNATTNGAAVGLAEGVIVSISIVPPASVPRGRIYGQVQVLSQDDTIRLTPWSGYVHTGGAPTAFPGIPCNVGDRVRFVATHGTNGAGVTLRALVGIAPGRVEGIPVGVFFYEAPGSGQGELFSVSLGDPAAGADYTTLTVPAVVSRRMTGLRGRLVAAAVAANRIFEIFYEDGSANVLTASVTPRVQTSGETIDYNGAIGGSAHAAVGGTTGRIQLALPDYILQAGHRLEFATTGIDPSDNWGAGRAAFEEWAVP